MGFLHIIEQFVHTVELDNYIVVWKLVHAQIFPIQVSRHINWDATTCRALYAHTHTHTHTHTHITLHAPDETYFRSYKSETKTRA